MIKEIKNSTLFFDGCNTVELAKKYGTPLYIYSVTDMTNRIEELKDCFTRKYENTRIAYAAKAFLTLSMLKFIEKKGLCLDVVSGGELYTAIKANFPAERIEFNGNNKLKWEIDMAVEYGVGRIIIDGSEELDFIISAAKKFNKKVDVLYRLTPGVAADSHDYIVTGKKDSKFGFHLDLKNSSIESEIQKSLAAPEINLLGFHFHIGSQLFENTAYLESLDIIFNFLIIIKEKYNFEISELNIGGGFGINYTSEDQRKPFNFFFEPIMEKIEKFFKNHNMQRPTIVTEPGRSIVGEAGITLYEIGNIKNIEGIRKYVSVDGGMTDNIRVALYQAKYNALIANKADLEPIEKVTICGKCCESGDILIKDIILPKFEPNDILSVFSTGAYGYSMASNYNNMLIPAVVFVEKGKDTLVVKRQSFEDLVKNDIV